MQVQEEKRVLDSRARAVPISSLSWSCVNLITMASSGNGVVFANVLSMIEDTVALLSQEQSDCLLYGRY